MKEYSLKIYLDSARNGHQTVVPDIFKMRNWQGVWETVG